MFILEGRCGLMTVVAVYPQPEDHELRGKEQLYSKLELVVGRCLTGDFLVFLGNFNAETGRIRIVSRSSRLRSPERFTVNYFLNLRNQGGLDW